MSCVVTWCPSMGIEIERKFLVKGDAWRAVAGPPRTVRQGYLAADAPAVVRVRTIAGRAYLTVKTATPGRVRAEYEYQIPLHEAEEMLERLCAPRILEKRRHTVTWDELEWMVDEFSGALEGLVLAEIELFYADQDVALPPWLGREVTGDPAYANHLLARCGRPADTP